MVAGEILDTGDGFGALTESQTAEVISAYLEAGSYESASLKLTFPYSWPSVARLIRWAVEHGRMSPDDKNPTGRRPRESEAAKLALDRHPSASASGIANLTGCSEATVYRVKRGE